METDHWSDGTTQVVPFLWFARHGRAITGEILEYAKGKKKNISHKISIQQLKSDHRL